MREFLKNAEDTEAFGKKISPHFRAGDIVRITGNLGAGKTTLVRGIIAGLGGDPAAVHSPTFSLVHEYFTPKFVVNHCDFYRLRPPSYLEDFGGLEFFEEDKLFLIEWPSHVALFDSITSSRLLDVDLQHDSDGRIVTLTSPRQIVD